MAHITIADAQAFAEPTKLGITEIDPSLEQSMVDDIFARLGAQFDTSTWVDDTTTPKIVRRIISMLYVSFTIHKAFNQTEDHIDPYAALLARRADLTVQGLLAGTEVILDDSNPNNNTAPIGQPVFYPTDASSALLPTIDDTSLGGPKFSMGTVF